MRKILLSCLTALFTVGLFSSNVSAESAFMKALKAKYEFKSVSCYTCHAKKDEIPEADLAKFEEDPKEFRNAFGKLFVPLLEGKKTHSRLEEAKALKKDDMDDKAEAIEAGVTKDFLAALAAVEAMKAANGKTYGELLKAGEVEGVRLPE